MSGIMENMKSEPEEPLLASLYKNYARMAYDPEAESRRKDVYKRLVIEGAASIIKANNKEGSLLELHKIILSAPFAAEKDWMKKYLDDVEIKIKELTGKVVDARLN